MVRYVKSITDPIEDHMAQHDKWHLQNLQAGKTLIITQGLVLIGIVVDIILHNK